jgi:hypothetical protein
MEKILHQGQANAVKELKKVLLEIKKNTRVLSENKSSLRANKQLLENLRKYKKIGNRYLGYKVLLEGLFSSIRRIASLGKKPEFRVPMPSSPDQSFKNGAIKKKLDIFSRVLKEIINKDENSGTELSDYISSVIYPLVSKARKTFEKSESFKLDKIELDQAAENMGQAANFLKNYVLFFKDKESNNIESAVKSLSSAFRSEPTFDKMQFKKEIIEKPEILDVNKDIATISELVDIPEFVNATTSFFKSPLKSVSDFFSSGLDSASGGGGGLFGRAPRE